MNWIGFDIGGANIKMASSNDQAIEIAFPMWLKHESLTSELIKLLAKIDDDAAGVAVTMTGELADCFEGKGQGVEAIVKSVVTAASGRPVVFYRTDGSWYDAEMAIKNPMMIAAANWHALATFAARFLPAGCGYLVDIGSTTTDVIPIRDSIPVIAGAQPMSDVKRMAESQLVYTGVWRSSLTALLNTVSISGRPIRVANEMFATIGDAYVWSGLVPEAGENLDTADSRPASRRCSGQRLARMVCSDLEEIGDDAIDSIAQSAIEANDHLVAEAIDKVVSSNPDLPLEFVVSGSGSWLGERVLNQIIDRQPVNIYPLDKKLDPSVCRSAAAHAVMKLAESQFSDGNDQPK